MEVGSLTGGDGTSLEKAVQYETGRSSSSDKLDTAGYLHRRDRKRMGI